MEFDRSATVIVAARDARAASTVSRFRLPVWIAGVTPSERVARHLQFSYGVQPVLEQEPITDWRAFARAWDASHDLTSTMGVLIRGPSSDRPDASHAIELIDLVGP